VIYRWRVRVLAGHHCVVVINHESRCLNHGFIYSITGCVTGESDNNKRCHSQGAIIGVIVMYSNNTVSNRRPTITISIIYSQTNI